MPFKLNRAMGYGMPWEKFEALCTLPVCGDDDDEMWEVLFNTFNGFKENDLTMSKEERSEFSSGQHRPFIITRNLLQLDIKLGSDAPVEVGHGGDLFTFVGNLDKTTDVIFFPNLVWGKKWYRTADILDLVFDTYGEGGGDGEHRYYTNYRRLGFYPYGQYVMTKDGTPVDGEHIVNFTFEDVPLTDEHEIVGAVPGEIRWYMTKHGILTNEGVNELRPVLAQWWT